MHEISKLTQDMENIKPENKNEKKIDLLLVNPLWTRKPFLPRNLFELGSFLIEHGYNPSLCDLNVALNEAKTNFIKKAVETIKSYQCKILCFAASVNTAPFVFELVNRIKENGDFTVVVGGLFATSNPKVIFDNCNADYVITGEGFKALKGILDTAKEGIKNFAGENLINKGLTRITKTIATPPTIIPFDAEKFQKLADIEPYTKEGCWSTYISKGCNNHCDFCSSSILWQNSRHRRTADVLNEIRYIKAKYSVKKFQFFDDCLANNKDFISRFLKEIKNLGINWICNARIDDLSSEIIMLMASSGCKKIYHGIESPSKCIRENLGKKIMLDKGEILDVLKFEKQMGIEPTCSFLCAFPEEGKKDLDETSRFISVLKKNKINTQLNLFIPFDGIRLSKKCQFKTINKVKEFGKSEIFTNKQFEMYPELINKYRDSNPENRICLTNIGFDVYKMEIKKCN